MCKKRRAWSRNLMAILDENGRARCEFNYKFPRVRGPMLFYVIYCSAECGSQLKVDEPSGARLQRLPGRPYRIQLRLRNQDLCVEKPKTMRFPTGRFPYNHVAKPTCSSERCGIGPCPRREAGPAGRCRYPHAASKAG